MTLILKHQDIQHKINRIAYQIYETHLSESEIILVGIEGNGYIFAQNLQKKLSEITDIQVSLCKICLNKKNPLEGIETSLEKEAYQNKAIVLVDDVLNSGKTLIYGVKHFLEVPLKKLTTAVLVNRNHKNFPIKADFKGVSLSTSLQENIRVDFEEGNFKAYLE